MYIVTELLDQVIWGRPGEASSPSLAEAKVENQQLLTDGPVGPSDGGPPATATAAARRKEWRRIIGQSALRVLLVGLTCFIGVVFKNFGLVCC
jgi:hypothetical protein